MNAEHTALILIEYQNDFVSEGGAQHDAVKAVMASTDMLANSRTLVAEARQRGVTIMHAAIAFAEGYPEAPAHPARSRPSSVRLATPSESASTRSGLRTTTSTPSARW